jgi:hypothetical protein
VSSAPTKAPEGSVRRPVGITVLMWLGVVQGLLLVGVGGLLVAVRGDPAVQTALEAEAVGLLGGGVILALLGLARLGLAVALGRGHEVVRSLFGAVAMVQAGGAVYSLVALRDVRIAVVWPFVLAVVELYLLYGSDRAQEFFAR